MPVDGVRYGTASGDLTGAAMRGATVDLTGAAARRATLRGFLFPDLGAVTVTVGKEVASCAYASSAN